VTASLHVLLAEDNEVNRRVAMRLLEREGHSVTAVLNGQEAIEALAREPFDAVLMDVQMPVLDGIEAARRIREGERVTGGHVPIIALTARAMKEDRDICMRSGMDGYLSKPVRVEELLRLLAETVGRA
jgi:CheY-like chemotaxis protein